MTVTINTAGKNELSSYVRLLVGGAIGSDLTRLALTSPNPLFVTCGANKTPLALAGAKYVDIANENDLFALKLALEGTEEERLERLGFPVDTLVFNTFDDFQRIILVNRVSGDKRSEPAYGDWFWLSSRLDAIISGLSNLNLHIIILSKVTTNEDSGRIALSIQGAFGTQIHNYVDYAFLLDTAEEEYVDPADVEVDLKENEIVVKSTYIGTTAYLLTQPSDKASWVHDDTALLPRTIDLTFDSDWDILFENIKAIIEAAPESSTFVIEDKVEEEDAEVVITVEPKAEAVVPGMSSATTVKDLLAERRNSMKEKETV